MKKLEEFESCAERLRALAEPARLRIVTCLLAGPRNVGELSEALNDDIVKVSHHLGVLRQAQIVCTEKHGRFVVYSLHPDVTTGNKTSAAHQQINLGCCALDLPAERSRVVANAE